MIAIDIFSIRIYSFWVSLKSQTSYILFNWRKNKKDKQ